MLDLLFVVVTVGYFGLNGLCALAFERMRSRRQ